MSGGGGGEGPSIGWLVSYADMVTNLMMFFIVMYAFAATKGADPTAYKEFIRQLESQFDGSKYEKSSQNLFDLEAQKSAEEIKSFTHLQQVNKNIGVNVSDERYQIILQNPVMFEEGSGKLKPGADQTLDDIVNVISQFPYAVSIEGHTDNVPMDSHEYPSNWELSGARAVNVLKYFAAHGIQPERLSGAGYGEFRPMFPNDTPENRSLNRRIEINVIRST